MNPMSRFSSPRGQGTLPRLNVPSVDLTHKPKPYVRVKSLHIWATELPIGNTTVAAHQLLEQLKKLNSARYPVKERLALHNTLRPVLHNLLTAIKQSLRQAMLPLDSKQQYSIDLLQTLLEQMAVGYKLIVTELALTNPQKHRDTEQIILQEACYCAIIYLAQRLVEAYGIYAPASPRVWMDLNQLYQFASTHDLHGAVIDDPYPDTPLPVQHTIDYAYKRIVLLALAEPYHLMEYEAADMYRIIAPSAPACVIEPMGLHIPDGAYAIDLNGDAGPRYISADMPWQASDGKQVDITSIKTQLEIHLQRILRANMQSPEFEATSLVERQQRDMLLRLADAWSGSLIRRIQRFQLEGQVQLTSGINACHHYISGETNFTPAMDELKLLTQSDYKNNKKENHSVFVTVYREALQRDRKHRAQNFALNPWWQRNISPIGIALNCDETCSQLDMRVGELVAYRFAQKGSHRWRVGVSRWLQVHADESAAGRIHIGIMNLATGAVPIGSKGISGLGSGTDYFRGLFIPKQVTLDQNRSIIVPAFIYDINSVLAINMKERLFHVRLTRLRLSTRSFTQFDFEIVSTPHNINFL